MNIKTVRFKNLGIDPAVPMQDLLERFDKKPVYSLIVSDKKRPGDEYTIDVELMSMKKRMTLSQALRAIRSLEKFRPLTIFELLAFSRERAHTSYDQRFFTEDYAIRPMPDGPKVRYGKFLLDLRFLGSLVVYPEDLFAMTAVSAVDDERFDILENAVDSLDKDQAA